MLRRFLSFLMASAILLAGLALAAAEVVRAEGIRSYLLVGAGLMIGAAGVWLVDEFLRTQRRRWRWVWNAMTLSKEHDKLFADLAALSEQQIEVGLAAGVWNEQVQPLVQHSSSRELKLPLRNLIKRERRRG
jgi:hypothetical protein